MATKPAAYKKPTYSSKYQPQVDTALGKVTNRGEFSYDPLQDANYQALEQIYNKRGEQAAKNTLADAASLNGGYGSSYAVTASAQARNDYNQELAAQIPALADAAYNRYVNNYNMDVTALNALMDAEDSNYNKYRDKVADSQWKYGMDIDEYRYKNDFAYQKARDKIADAQWNSNFEYQKSRDKVADDQWLKEFNLANKGSSGGGGSRRSGGGGSGGGYYSGGSASSGLQDWFNGVWGQATGSDKAKKKKGGAVALVKGAGKKTKKKSTAKK